MNGEEEEDDLDNVPLKAKRKKNLYISMSVQLLVAIPYENPNLCAALFEHTFVETEKSFIFHHSAEIHLGKMNSDLGETTQLHLFTMREELIPKRDLTVILGSKLDIVIWSKRQTLHMHCVTK